jgi:hypothetical protein
VYPSDDVVKICKAYDIFIWPQDNNQKNAFEKIQHSVLKHFVGVPVFKSSFDEHSTDKDALNFEQSSNFTAKVSDHLLFKYKIHVPCQCDQKIQ